MSAACTGCLAGQRLFAESDAPTTRVALWKAAAAISRCTTLPEAWHINAYAERRGEAELIAAEQALDAPPCLLCEASLDPELDVVLVDANHLGPAARQRWAGILAPCAANQDTLHGVGTPDQHDALEELFQQVAAL